MQSLDAERPLRSTLELPATVGMHAVTLEEADRLVADMAIPAALANAYPKRRREFLAGRYCARQALRSLGGEMAGESLPVGSDRLPQWPSGWLGSISHSRLAAVAVVERAASCTALGIDLEAWLDEAAGADVEPQITLPGELELLAAWTRPRALTLLFSAKEALFKALYPQVRRFLDFQAAQVVALTPERLQLRLVEDWSERWPRGSVLDIRYACLAEHVCTALRLPR